MTPGADTADALVIRKGRIIDPARGVDRVGDMALAGGKIAERAPAGARVFDASNLIVTPGFIDLHVHLREPGGEHKETIATGCAAAAAGGFTAVTCMPNTTPALDTPERIAQVVQRAEQAGTCRVLPIAAITRGRAGRELTDFRALLDAGAVAFSDDGDGVQDDDVMRAAFEQARACDALVIQHCEVNSLSAGGVLHRGPTADALGLPGIDPAAEEAMIERDLQLVRETGARYHVAHISTARSVELVRQAKREGLPVTTEVCPHHLLLTDRDCADGNSDLKMHPPLRSAEDVEACRAGLLDGTIDCLVTDHAPHTAEEKAVGFRNAPFGIVGLETIVPLLATNLVGGGLLDWSRFLALLSVNACGVLGLERPTLAQGRRADVCLIDPDANWTIRAADFHSRSRNTPFDGWPVSVRPVATIRRGHFTYLWPGGAARRDDVTPPPGSVSPSQNGRFTGTLP
ncbi:MAG: dihydroorotase [bacterium]|nr:dihydroorotase [bacterium]